MTPAEAEYERRAKWIVRELRRLHREGKRSSFTKLMEMSKFRVIEGGKNENK